MQTRWMLWTEEGDTLTFLRAIPRRWLEDGKEIRLANVATYFGPVSLAVVSRLAGDGTIVAEARCLGDRRPDTVTIRLPHPEGLRPRDVAGGRYDRQSETVTIAPFCGCAKITLRY